MWLFLMYKTKFLLLFSTFSVLNDMIEDMGEFLQSKYDAVEFSHVAIPTQVILVHLY